MKAAAIGLALQLDGRAPRVELDDSLVRQALLNLLRNAVQAMESGGVLTVQTRFAADSMLVEIIDTGAGMTPEVKARVFDVFFSTKPGGTGVGLPLVRQIVERHGGEVSCDSAPGHGTRFTIRFPLTPSSATPESGA